MRGLDARGLVVRQGTLIDASLIAAAVAEPRRQPGGGTSPVDPEASWAKKGSKATFGYKLHIAVDQGSGLVRAARLTNARVADCTVGPDLVQGDEGAVYADMAYDNAVMRARLEAGGIANAVMARPNRYHPLTEEAKARNDLIARLKTRSEGLDDTVVAAYPSAGPKGYDVDPKAEVTVIFYDRLKVLDNWAFEAGKMTEKDASAIVKQIETRLQVGKSKATKNAA